jgi:hypothetical protein
LKAKDGAAGLLSSEFLDATWFLFIIIIFLSNCSKSPKQTVVLQATFIRRQ